MKPKRIIHLLSGGLDSVTLLHDILQQGHHVHCMLADYKQQHVQELTFAKGHCRKLGVSFTTTDLPKLGGLNEESWIVPNRNCILLSLATNLAVQTQSSIVTIGCNRDDRDGFPDCRQAFLDGFNTTMKLAEIPVKVLAPYLNRRKSWIAKRAKQLDINLSQIWTCYRGGAKPCGTCPACLKLTAANT